VRKKDQKAMDILDKMHERFGYEFQAKYNLQPQDAVGLGLLKEFIWEQFLIPWTEEFGDREFFITFRMKNNHVEFLYNRDIYLPSFEIFELFTRLEGLIIWENHSCFNNFEGLANLKNLKVLKLDVGLTCIDNLEGINNLKDLKVLHICNTGIKDIKGISNLRKLEEINLSGNLIKDIKPFNQFTNLKKLNLTKNWITEIKDPSKLQKLEILNLNENYLLGDEIKGLKYIKKMKNLRVINLLDNKSPEDLKKLKVEMFEELRILNKERREFKDKINLDKINFKN
jgi:hypothetical protein